MSAIYRTLSDPRVGRAISNSAKALALARQIATMLNVETKNFDTSPFPGAAVDNSGTVVSLSNIPSEESATDQGSARDGDQVRYKSIYLRGQVQIHASATATRLRMMLLIDKQSNAGLPSVADILEGGGIDNPMNMANRMRFRILRDHVFLLDSDDPQRLVKQYVKLYGRAVWAGDTTDEASTNNLVLVMISNEATNTPTATISARLRYVDN